MAACRVRSSPSACWRSWALTTANFTNLTNSSSLTPGKGFSLSMLVPSCLAKRIVNRTVVGVGTRSLGATGGGVFGDSGNSGV